MFSFAVGELKLTKQEFLNLYWNEYEWKCNGFFKQHERDYEKYHWIVWNLMQPHQKKGSVKPFNKYLESLKPRPELTKKEKEQRNKSALYMRKKFEKTQRYRDSLNG